MNMKDLAKIRVKFGLTGFLLTGVSNTQELLVSASHRVRAAVQSSVQAEKSMGLCAQVSLRFLNYADNLGGHQQGRLSVYCPLAF